MAKTAKYTVEKCASKYVLKNVNKPTGYLRPNGKLTPFLDGDTLMVENEATARRLEEALNKNHTALLIKMVLESEDQGMNKEISKKGE